MSTKPSFLTQKKFPAILAAPLCGYTSHPFRKILENYPYDLLFTEMLSVDALYYGNKSTETLAYTHEETNTATQLFGSNVDRFLLAVEQLSKKNGFKVFDINLGCPVAKVMKSGGGSALLKNPELVYKIVLSLTKEFPHLTFSGKIRIGINAQELTYKEISQALQDAGADFITVHGRTQKQVYSGEVHFEILKEIKNSLSIPVIANGGIFTPLDAKEMLDKTNCDGIMLSRGMIGNPELALYVREFLETGSYSPISLEEKLSIMQKHFELEDKFNPHSGFKEFKKSALSYVKGIPDIKPLKIKISCSNSASEMRGFLEEIKELALQKELSL